MGVCNSKKGKHDVVNGHKKKGNSKKNVAKISNTEDTLQSTQPQCDVPPNLDNTPQTSDVLRAEEAKREDLERLKRHGGFISYNQFDHDELQTQLNEQSATIHKTEQYTIELATVPTSPPQPPLQQQQHMTLQSKTTETGKVELAGPPLAGMESHANIRKKEEGMSLHDKHDVKEEQQVASLLSTTVAACAKPTGLTNATQVNQEVNKKDNIKLAKGNNNTREIKQKDDDDAETDDSSCDNNVFSDPSADESDISDKENNHKHIDRYYYNRQQNDNTEEIKNRRIIVTDNKAGASDEESENVKQIALATEKNEAESTNNDKIIDVRHIEVDDQSTSKSNTADQVKTVNTEISNTLNTLTASSVTGVPANAASSTVVDSSNISASPDLSLQQVENANATTTTTTTTTGGKVVQVPATSHVQICENKESDENMESDNKSTKDVLQEFKKTTVVANEEVSDHVLIDRGSSNARVEEVVILPTKSTLEECNVLENNEVNEDTPVIRRAPPPPPSPPLPSSEPEVEPNNANEAHELHHDPHHPSAVLDVADNFEKHNHPSSVNETEQVIVHADHTITRTKIQTSERSIPMHELYDHNGNNNQNAHISELHANSIMTDAHNRPIGTFEQTEVVFTSSSSYPNKASIIVNNNDTGKINVVESSPPPLIYSTAEGKEERVNTTKEEPGANKNGIVEEPETMTSATNDSTTKSSSSQSSEENLDRNDGDESGEAEVERTEDVEIVKTVKAGNNVTQNAMNEENTKKDSSQDKVKCTTNNNIVDVTNKQNNDSNPQGQEMNKEANDVCNKQLSSEEEQDEEEDQGTVEQKGNPREVTQASTASEMYLHPTMTTNTTYSQPVHNASLSISSEPERSDNANAFFGEDDDTTQLNRADTTNTNNPSQVSPYLFNDNDNDENNAHNGINNGSNDDNNNESSSKISDDDDDDDDDATEQEEKEEEEEENEHVKDNKNENENDEEWIDNDSSNEEEDAENTSSSEKDAAEHDSDEDAVIPFHAAFPLRTHQRQQKQHLEEQEQQEEEEEELENKTHHVQHNRHFDPLNEKAIVAPFRRTEKSTQQVVNRLQATVQQNNFIQSDSDGMEEGNSELNWFDLHYSHNTNTKNNKNINKNKYKLISATDDDNSSNEEQQHESHRDQECSSNVINSNDRQQTNMTYRNNNNDDIFSTLFDNYKNDHITKTRPHRIPPPLPEAEDEIDEEVKQNRVQTDKQSSAADKHDNMEREEEQKQSLTKQEEHQEDNADNNETNYVDKDLVISRHSSNDDLQRMAPKELDSESSESSSSTSSHENYKWPSLTLKNDKRSEQKYEYHHHQQHSIIEHNSDSNSNHKRETTKTNLASAQYRTPTKSTVIISPSIPDDLL